MWIVGTMHYLIYILGGEKSYTMCGGLAEQQRNAHGQNTHVLTLAFHFHFPQQKHCTCRAPSYWKKLVR